MLKVVGTVVGSTVSSKNDMLKVLTPGTCDYDLMWR